MISKNNMRRIMLVPIFLCLVLAGLGIGVLQDTNRVERIDSTHDSFVKMKVLKNRAPTYLDLTLMGDDTYYSGDQDNEFHFFVSESYDGSEYEGDDLGDESWLNDDLFDSNMYFQDFMDEDAVEALSETQNPFEGFTSGFGTPYNGEGNDGYTLSGARNWYATDENDDFRLNVKDSTISGIYTIHVQLRYKIRVDYNNSTGYQHVSRMEDFYVELEIQSGIDVEKKEGATIYSPNDTPGATLYAGAARQKIGLTGLATHVDDIGDIQGTLSYSGTEIEIPTSYKNAYKKELAIGNGGTLYWRINVDENADPGYYELSLTITYTRFYDDGDANNDVTITERGIKLQVTVEFTPILAPQDSAVLTVPVKELDQELEDKKVTLTASFTNDGNVDLTDIEVALDLSNARYFYTTGFYYDEDNQAQIKDFGAEKTINELKVGDSTTVSFEVIVRNDIPSGKYVIPVMYDAKFFDTGVLGGSSIDKDTDEDEYNVIMQARGKEEPDDDAYIYVLVEDSLLDLEATTNQVFQPGTIEANLFITLQNTDGYDLHQLNISIAPSSKLPIVPSGGRNYFNFITVDNLNSGGFTTLQFNVNVKEGATLGTHDIPIKVQATNHLEESITRTVMMPLEIIPIPPQLVVTKVETPWIHEGDKFDLKVTVSNIGGSKATNITLQLLDNNNQFEMQKETDSLISAPFDLNVSQSRTLIFKLKAHKVDAGTIYNLTGRVQYKNSKGQLIRYSQSAPLTILVKIDKAPMDHNKLELEHYGTGWFYIIFAVIGIIMIIFLPFIFFYTRKKFIKKKKEKKHKKHKEHRHHEEPMPPMEELTPEPETRPRPPKHVYNEEPDARIGSGKMPQGETMDDGAPRPPMAGGEPRAPMGYHTPNNHAMGGHPSGPGSRMLPENTQRNY